MSESDKVRHLLRRFGLGGGRYQAKPYIAMGFKKAVDALLHDDEGGSEFPISPWEFGAQKDGKIDSGAYQLAGWWSLRFMMTKRPLEEKLTLFWHDHFALDAEKIYELPTMAGYLEVLRTKGRGKFRDLLHAVFKQGAMYVFLDNEASNRMHPNENFARELFELFTLGIGNYTEKDIQETARALTGWSTHYLGTGFNMDYETLRMQAVKNNLSLNNVCYVPAIHDAGEKTIFGVTKAWTAEDVLDAVADHPKTIRYISKKLWEWFAYENPTEATIDKLERAWKSSKGEIRAVLQAIVNAPEFWSDGCVGKMPKSPVDFTIGMFRSLDMADDLLKLRGTPTNTFAPINQELRDLGGGLFYLMSLQGMRILFPPNVAGWDWYDAWINSSISSQRMNMSGNLFYGGGKDRIYAVRMAAKLKEDDKVTTPEQLVAGFADILDIPLDDASKIVLANACTKYGGVKALDNKDAAASLFARLGKVAFAMPQAQLC